MQSLASVDRATQTADDDDKTSPIHSPLSPRRHSPIQMTDSVDEAREAHDDHDDHGNPYAHDHSGDGTDEEVEIHEAPTVVAQAKMVTIPKRLPPSLPPRNPQRMSTPTPKEKEESELADGFDNVSLDPERDVQATQGDDQFHSIPSSPVDEAKKPLA